MVQWLALVLAFIQLAILIFIVYHLYVVATNETAIFSGLVLFCNISAFIWFATMAWTSLTIFFKPNLENPASDKKFVWLLAGATLIPLMVVLVFPVLFLLFL